MLKNRSVKVIFLALSSALVLLDTAALSLYTSAQYAATEERTRDWTRFFPVTPTPVAVYFSLTFLRTLVFMYILGISGSGTLTAWTTLLILIFLVALHVMQVLFVATFSAPGGADLYYIDTDARSPLLGPAVAVAALGAALYAYLVMRRLYPRDPWLAMALASTAVAGLGVLGYLFAYNLNFIQLLSILNTGLIISVLGPFLFIIY